MTSCPHCGFKSPDSERFCTNCGRPIDDLPEPAPAAAAAASRAVVQPPRAPAPAPRPAPPPQPPVQGRAHSPVIALLSGIIFPGAGQAYNGQPIKGFFFLFLSVLVLPFLYSLYDAFATAGKISARGGRMGKGGLIWVFLQAWLVFNVMLLAVIVLSYLRILQ